MHMKIWCTYKILALILNPMSSSIFAKKTPRAGGSGCKNARKCWIQNGGLRFYMCICASSLHVHRICSHYINVVFCAIPSINK
jgi:hypothetical protein